MEARVCTKCGESKPVLAFALRSDGKLNLRCKECVNAYCREHRAANREAYSERARARWRDRPDIRERYRQFSKSPKGVAAKRRWAERHPLKQYAHMKIADALKHGRMERNPCEVCGAWSAQAHHDDYTKPLDVRWLCPAHHAEWHRHNKPICPDQLEVA